MWVRAAQAHDHTRLDVTRKHVRSSFTLVPSCAHVPGACLCCLGPRARLSPLHVRSAGALGRRTRHMCAHTSCAHDVCPLGRLATRLARASLATRLARLLASPRLLATHLLASPARRLLASPTRLSFASILARRLPARTAAMKWKEVIRVGKGEGARGCRRENAVHARRPAASRRRPRCLCVNAVRRFDLVGRRWVSSRPFLPKCAPSRPACRPASRAPEDGPLADRS